MRLLLLLAALVVGAGSLSATGAHPYRLATGDVLVAPNGNDATCVRGIASRPCASIGRAYSLARCGDIVEVAAGAYPAQQLVEIPRLSLCPSNVVVQSASLATVTLDRIDLGTVAGGYAQDVPDRLTLKGLIVVNGIVAWGDGNDLVWDEIDGGAFFVQGVQNLTIKNSDWGPCGSSTTESCYTFFSRQPVIASNSDDKTETKGIVLENNVIHDFDLNKEGDHFECIRTDGGRDLTLRGNRIFNCETYGMTITQPRGTWIIEGNWFGRTCCYSESPPVDRFSAIVVGDGAANANVIIRDNNFGAKQTVVTEGATGFETVKVRRNILQSYWCITGVRYDANLFINFDPESRRFSDGSQCSPTDRTAVYGYSYDGERLRRDEPSASAVAYAFAAVADGTELRTVRRSLRRRAPAPPGGWTVNSVRTLLHDPVYLGNRLGIPALHKAIITRSHWNAVQKALRS